jgi:hypothetical protein
MLQPLATNNTTLEFESEKEKLSKLRSQNTGVRIQNKNTKKIIVDSADYWLLALSMPKG